MAHFLCMRSGLAWDESGAWQHVMIIDVSLGGAAIHNGLYASPHPWATLPV